MKKGFGLLEVIIAAVALGFLIVGLNGLQMGNREGVLRVRARDAANSVAQRILDSIGSVGVNSIKAEAQAKCGGKLLVYCEPKYEHSFGNYAVEVELLNEERKSINNTYYTETQYDYAKSIEATVSWKFKQSTQSIKVAKVVR